ncbi:MAG: glycosyltransferase family 2 protein [Candidatus Omnitrophica bacterium]|nr:glycosyltransferase family 2 protein [Candidatus Omnitrophota bacterium]
MPNGEPNIHLSIVIPAYNEASNISFTLEDVAQYLKNKDYTHEIIVVNDGSHDDTATIAASHNRLFQRFALLENETNKGKGNAVKKGVLQAQGEFILFMDADNSTRISQLDKLMSAVLSGSDIAMGSRRTEGSIIEESQPIARVILGNIYILLSQIILGTRVKDYNCGFKLYKKAIAKKLFSQLTQDDWSFDSELIYLAARQNLSIKEVPVNWQDKKKTSKVKPFRDGIKSFVSLLKIKFKKH